VGRKRTVDVDIKGKETVSKEAKKAQESLKGFSKASISGINSLRSSLMSAAAPVAAVIAGITLLARGIKSLTDAYAEQEAADKKLEAVLKATGNQIGYTTGELKEYATELSRLTGIDDALVQDAESIMLTFTKVGRDVFPQAIEAAADMSAIFGGELSQSATQLGKALNDPVAGVGALRRVGVSFTEAQKDQIKALVEANDILGAQQIILNELRNEFGGTAREMGSTWTQSVGKYKNAMGDLREAFGERWTTAFKPVLAGLTKFIEQAADAAAAANALSAVFAGTAGLDQYQAALEKTQDDLDLARAQLEALQRSASAQSSRTGRGGGYESATNAMVEAAKKRVSELEAQFVSIEVVVKEMTADMERQEAARRKIAEYLALEQAAMDIVADLAASLLTDEEKELATIREQLTTLREYKATQERGSAGWLKAEQAILALLEKEKTLKEQIASQTRVILTNEGALIRTNTTYAGLLESAANSYQERLDALEGIKLIEDEIAEAILEGNTAWLEQLEVVKARLLDIAGITDEEETQTGTPEEKSTSGYGELGSIIEAAVTGDIIGTILTTLLDAAMDVEEFAAIINGVTGIFTTLISIVSGPLSTALAPIVDYLVYFGTLLGSTLAPILLALSPILSLVASLLSLLAAPLELLQPIILAIAVALEVLMSQVKWLADAIKWLVEWVKYLGDAFAVAIYNFLHPFKTQKTVTTTKPGALESDAFSGLDDRIAEILEIGTTDYTATALDDVSPTGSNTTVQRVPDIYIYTTIEGNIYGDGSAEFGENVARAIEAYYGIGGRITVLEGV